MIAWIEKIKVLNIKPRMIPVLYVLGEFFLECDHARYWRAGAQNMCREWKKLLPEMMELDQTSPFKRLTDSQCLPSKGED